MADFKLMIATPTQHGAVSLCYADGIASLRAKSAAYGVPIVMGSIVSNCYIPDARNILVEEFLKTDATHLMFIDSDIGFDSDYVFHMMEWVKDPKYNILGAYYPKKQIVWPKVYELVKRGVPLEILPALAADGTVSYLDGKYPGPEDGKRPFEVAELATGFLMIRRSMFELFREKYPERVFSKGKRCLYFHCEIMDDEYIGDDFYFCKLMRALGEKIWLCPWMDLTHHGQFMYGAPMK